MNLPQSTVRCYDYNIARLLTSLHHTVESLGGEVLDACPAILSNEQWANDPARLVLHSNEITFKLDDYLYTVKWMENAFYYSKSLPGHPYTLMELSTPFLDFVFLSCLDEDLIYSHAVGVLLNLLRSNSTLDLTMA